MAKPIIAPPALNAGSKLTGRWRVEVQFAGNRKRGRFDTIAEAQNADVQFAHDLKTGVTEGVKRKFTQDRSRPQSLGEAGPTIRSHTRWTCIALHRPPRRVLMPRSFNR